jgi:hypothetical protein
VDGLGRSRVGLGCRAAIALSLAVAHPAEALEEVANSRLKLRGEMFAVARALHGASLQLEAPRCDALMDEFVDASGRPLRAALSALGVGARSYLSRVFFYDARPSLCGTFNLAITAPGSRVVFVCGSRFAREMQNNPRYGEATIIHETLHSLGLGENPPSSDFITSRVLSECGHRSQPPAGSTPQKLRRLGGQPLR